MFPEHLKEKDLEIEEGNELVGFAIAVDECGNPGWLDFVVTRGGQWMYREFETCDKFHPLKTFKLLNSNEESFECNLCKVLSANQSHGYFTF